MDAHQFDVVVIGAGIVGATAAAHLAADRRVALVEAEEVAGYHTTGRSAAIWLQNYGPPDAQALTRASRSFLETPPAGFAAAPLMARRGAMYLATAGREPRAARHAGEAQVCARFRLPRSPRACRRCGRVSPSPP